MRTVVSLGGSALYSGGKFDSGAARRACYLLSLAAEREQIVVVVGGGPLAKKAADGERAKNRGEFYADLAAIEATWKNASLVKKFLKNSAFALKITDAPALLKKGKIVLSGGMLPGLTTDAVAVLFAEAVGARRVVNLSNVDGVYTSNPHEDKSAKKFKRLSHASLVRLAARDDSRHARSNFVFDLVACKLAARSKIRLEFVSLAFPDEVENALLGKPHNGTVVS